MSVHALRIKAGPLGIAGIETEIQNNFFDDFDEVLEDHNTAMWEKEETHYWGEYRVDTNYGKANVLDTIETVLTGLVSLGDIDWFKVEYHACKDNIDGEDCGAWTVERTEGDVPIGV